MSQRRSTTNPPPKAPRRPRRIHEETSGKLPELAGCPKCGASYRNGRWTWKKAPIGSYEQVCPACERIENDYPGGELHVQGDFAASHRDEILGLIHNVEEAEKKEHPLKRIMDIQDDDSGFIVRLTDGKLAESLGRALERAYEGQLEHPPTTTDYENLLVRVRWSRD